MSYREPSVGLERRQYFSSSQGPFHNAIELHMFFGGGGRGEIVETILRSLRDDDGIVQVHGECGSGKTMMSLVLAERLAERRNIIRYDHDGLDATTLLRHLLIELRPSEASLVPARDMTRDPAGDPIRDPARDSARDSARGTGAERRPTRLDAARDSVIEQLREPPPGGRPLLLLIDSDAPADAAVMRLLEALVAVRRAGRRAVQVVMFRRLDAEASRSIGLNREVNRPEDHYWLRRLSLAETGEYLRHHMMLYDFSRRGLFTREMTYFIADRSEGVFRAINTIARNAFAIASLENVERPTMSHLLLAGLPPRDLPPVRSGFVRRHRRAVIALIGSSVVASVLGAVLFAVR